MKVAILPLFFNKAVSLLHLISLDKLVLAYCLDGKRKGTFGDDAFVRALFSLDRFETELTTLF